MFFIRSIHLLRMFMLIIAYILMPFDLIPESVLGVMGYIDDFLLALMIICFFVAVAAVQYVRTR
jgi:uncharacterized membrane protein YkvA (DUF1232 family)